MEETLVLDMFDKTSYNIFSNPLYLEEIGDLDRKIFEHMWVHGHIYEFCKYSWKLKKTHGDYFGE